MTDWESIRRWTKGGFRGKSLLEHMKTVEDPRSPRAKKHQLAEVLTYMVAGYLSGRTTIRRCVRWAGSHQKWLRKGMRLENGIASVPTVSRLLSSIDEELFLYAFMGWVGEILDSRGCHIAIDGKAIRAAASRVRSEKAPMLMNAIDAATGLVLAQLPVTEKSNEITGIPKLLKLLNIEDSIITIDAIGTQTEIMDQIHEQDGHFVLLVKRNQPQSYDEIVAFIRKAEEELEKARNKGYISPYADLLSKYDEVSYMEQNRDRYEYRTLSICNDPSPVTKTGEEWLYVKSVGCIRQTRILMVRDKDGNDITPDMETFLKKGSARQPCPVEGDREGDDVQIIGIISDMEMQAGDMGRCKRLHWSVENRLHHILDDTFREDRSPAKKSKNNLALIRKFAYNILRIAAIRERWNCPMTEMMDIFADDPSLLERYIFQGIESFN